MHKHTKAVDRECLARPGEITGSIDSVNRECHGTEVDDMVIECGQRFWTNGAWERCVLDRKHTGRCQDRLDTADEVYDRAKLHNCSGTGTVDA